MIHFKAIIHEYLTISSENEIVLLLTIFASLFPASK